MVNLMLVVGITLAAMLIFGGGGYLIWAITRPKKMTWKARVYQVGEGIKPKLKDAQGKIVSDIKMSDLRPYTIDIVERVEKKTGITIYRLQKMNKVVPAVTTECVDYWGEKNKEVMVLLEGDTCTLLTKGYNRTTGKVIFQPMPHDRTSMIKSEMTIRQERIKEKKDILQAITPFIVIGFAMGALVFIVYITIEGAVEMSENNKITAQSIAEAQTESANILKEALILSGADLEDIGIKKEEPPPPSVESQQ